jgi:hypothetical protein
VEQGKLDLGDPVENYLPQLACGLPFAECCIFDAGILQLFTIVSRAFMVRGPWRDLPMSRTRWSQETF